MRNSDSGQADALDLSTGFKYEPDALANMDLPCRAKIYLARKLKEKNRLDYPSADCGNYL